MVALRPIAWIVASLRPSSGFSIFGHNRPGESMSVMWSLMLWLCWDLVTAGSSPTFATRRLSRVFISVDLPTLGTVSYTHLRAHETRHDLVCRLLLEKKKKK